jgi:hypothetical protein
MEGKTVDLTQASAVRLRMKVRTDGGMVTGFVYREEKPLAGAMVLLAPQGDSAEDDYLLFMTDLDGSFEFEGVKPGEYDLITSPDGTDLEFRNAAAMRPYRASAQSVTVKPRERQKLRVDVPAPGH